LMQANASLKLDALDRLYELSLRHATPEQRERLVRLAGAFSPNGSLGSVGYKQPEHDLFADEATAILFERVFAELAELRAMVRALTEPKPNPGRPPKGTLAREQEAG
jgi:hypothetical protein